MKIFGLSLPELVYRDFFQEIIKDLFPHLSLKERLERGLREEGRNIQTSPSIPLLQGEGKKKGARTVFTPNPEMLLSARKDADFFGVLQQADFLTSDGIGLYIAYQIEDFLKKRQQKHPHTPLALWERGWGGGLLPYYFFNLFFRRDMLYKKYGERICGSDVTEDLLLFAERNQIKIAIVDPYFPLDSGKCEAQKYFKQRLSAVFPKLLFQYYILFPEKKEEILASITSSDAEIFFATLGMKKQEHMCLEVQTSCPNIKLALAVGSSFDYHTGFQKRAPKIWRDAGFEWLYRIFTSPNKLKRLRRIFQAVVVFPLTVIFFPEK